TRAYLQISARVAIDPGQSHRLHIPRPDVNPRPGLHDQTATGRGDNAAPTADKRWSLRQGIGTLTNRGNPCARAPHEPVPPPAKRRDETEDCRGPGNLLQPQPIDR